MQINVTEIQNEEEKVIKVLRSLHFKPHRIVHLFGPTWSVGVANALNTDALKRIEDVQHCCNDYLTNNTIRGVKQEETSMLCYSMALKLIDWAYDMVHDRETTRTTDKARKMERKLSNRIAYKVETVLRRESVIKDGEVIKERWKGDTDLKAGGLMRLAVEHKAGIQDRPPVFAIQNHLPMEAEISRDGSVTYQRPEISGLEWIKMQRKGVIISGERIGWVKDSPAWRWLKYLFPKVIDCRAYNHSLNAPILPGGFLAEVPVKFTTIKTVNQQGNQISAETDGCGRIHPDHELFKSLQRPGGPCVVQFRFINLKGTFAKGILVPDERCVGENGEPEIWFDWMQVKGRNKTSAQKMATAQKDQRGTGYIGIIQVWDRPRTLKWSFEQLQMFHTNPETCAIVEEWVKQAYHSLLGEGIEGLLAGIASDNPQLKLVLQLAAAINGTGIEFSAVQIPMVKRAVVERLQKVLYFLAQGAGKNGKQVVGVLDNGIPEGHIVASGYKPGTQVVIHRFPTLLPQAMLKLTVINPLPHHKVNGKIVPNAVFMNNRDLTDKAQGDSDGDILAITDDPLALELMNHRIGSDRVYMVEPSGEKFDTRTDSDEGLDYMCGSPRGNVGVMCLHQAKLFSVGDLDSAIAMAFPYQEAVDVAKKKIRWTDFRLASDQDEWFEINGRWHFDKRLPQAAYDGEDLPEEMIAKWVNGRLRQAGVQSTREQNVIAWRSRGKRINPNDWVTCEERGNFSGGNLVHFCHDTALKLWNDYADKFDFNIESVDLSLIIQRLLGAHGLNFKPMDISWYRYHSSLRATSGIRDFGSSLRRIMSKDMEESERQSQIDTAIINLNAQLRKLTIPEMECVWRMELTDTFRTQDDVNGEWNYSNEIPQNCNTEDDVSRARCNNPNYAFRAIAWPGSSVMQLLGIEHAPGCTFLEDANSVRVTKIIGVALKNENPQRKLTELIFNSKLHGQEVRDENGHPIHGKDCTHCMTLLHNTLVQTIRKQRATVEHDFIRVMCRTLNK